MGQTSFRERYPPPWRVEEMAGGFSVVAANGITIAWIYSVDDGVQRAASPNSLRHVEALALAKAIVGLARFSRVDP